MVEKEIGQKSKEMALKGSLEKQTPMRGNFICLKKVPVSWLADEIKKKKIFASLWIEFPQESINEDWPLP